MNFTGTFFSDVIHLLYPHVCAGCGSDMADDRQLICSHCISALPVTGFSEHRLNPVEKMFRGRIEIVTASAHVYFTKQSIVQHLLHRLKYRGDKEVGLMIGRMMGKKLKMCELLDDVHAIIPLPLHHKKQKTRGYNQAELICNGISEEMNIPVLNDVVIRNRKTETQTHKSRMDRWQNIENRFELLNGAQMKPGHILLVDDVVTTGATLESCGRALLSAEGIRLSIATFAYTSL
jgi:ComF family protein